MITTARLILRPWQDEDREPFARLNADPEVMRYFAASLSRQESDALVDRIIARHADTGVALMPALMRDTHEFIGMVGIQHVPFTAPFTPAVEIGWRLDKRFWGKGLASEAARAWLDHGFSVLGLERIVAFTLPQNHPSQAVMTRIGMARVTTGDFDHPHLPETHPMRRHVLYEIRRTLLSSPALSRGSIAP
jgi:RimJ/RimL family protein N-acetyltransferase